MDKEKLNDILQKHKMWLNGEVGGEQGNLNNADLRFADLRFADLSSADLYGANLIGANLSSANLICADLSGANLSDADLSGANLSDADLNGADLSGADLRLTDLSGADLSGANLRFANLICANLSSANLSDANLICANLSGASLINANLIGADLTDVTVNSITAFYHLQCPEQGSFTAFKKLKDDLIAELIIPAKAKRSSATSRKCRASEAKVIRIYNPITKESFQKGVSIHDNNFIYEVGKIVKPIKPFDENRWNECGSGIHFFMTLQEAIDY